MTMTQSTGHLTTSTQPTVVSGKMQEQYTAQQVIEMFRALNNLLVTDDATAIESAMQKQNARRLREKTYSTDPHSRAQADLWFKHVQLVKDRRQELLEVVQGFFEQLANAALEGMFNAGVRELTPAVYDSLRTIAQEQCRLDDRLAQRFVDAYVAQRQLQVGAPLFEPKLVEAVTVTQEPGSLQLRWKFPTESCDEVIVKRQDKDAHTASLELCRGNRTEYVDTHVAAGRWYMYSIYSVFRGVESQHSQSIEAMAIGEIAQAEARWSGQAIELHWVNPAEHGAVVILRSEATRPMIRQGTDGLEPADASTLLLYRGAGSAWQDTHIEAGRTYRYLLLAAFDTHVYSTGVEVTGAVPAIPPPVTAAHAVYRDAAVDIWWTPAQPAAHEEYAVVRREGTVAAAAPEPHQCITTTSHTRYQDTQVEPGRRYIYTVFTRRNALYSHVGSATEVVMTLAEVQHLTIAAGDGTAALHWQTPPYVARILVRRGVQPPQDSTDGTFVSTGGPGYAQETDLQNGCTYHYLVCCVYRFSDGQEVASAGLRCWVTPSAPPQPVIDFHAQTEGTAIVCTWSPMAPGQVVTVVRCPTRPALRPGDLLNVAELARMGRLLPQMSPHRVEDSSPTPQEPYYAAFTVAGLRARAGPVYHCMVVADVTHLQTTLIKDGVQLSWDWPVHCQTVVIARRQGAWPESPHDPPATLVYLTRHQYRQQQESFRDMLAPDTGEYFYVVYAQPAGAVELTYAPGTSSGCRCRVRPRRIGQLTYSVRAVQRWFRPVALELRWEADDYPQPFSGFVIVGNGRGVPTSLDDGVPLLRFKPKNPQDYRGVPQNQRLNLRDIHLQQPTGRLYYKLFLLHPAERETLLLRHPDVSRPLELS